MILRAEKVLHDPVKCILAGLRTINTDDNVQHLGKEVDWLVKRTGSGAI